MFSRKGEGGPMPPPHGHSKGGSSFFLEREGVQLLQRGGSKQARGSGGMPPREIFINFVLQMVHFENTITQQILVALGPNVYHGCISVVSWLSCSKMSDLELFVEVMGVDLNMKISNFHLYTR